MANNSGASTLAAVLIPEEREKVRLEDRSMGSLVVVYRTVVVLGSVVFFLVYGDDEKTPAGLMWFLSLSLCVLLCIWSEYINEFLRNPPLTYEDSSMFVLLASVVMALAAVPVSDGGSRPLAGAAILILDVLLVAGYFGWCVAEWVWPPETMDSSQTENCTDQAGV